MAITLAEASKLAGVSRQTIYRKASSGELSTTRLPDGTKAVDPSELERVFGPLKTPETVTETVKSDTERHYVTSENRVLQVELEAAQTVIRTQEQLIQELRDDKAKLWAQVESQRLLLEHQKPETPILTVTTENPPTPAETAPATSTTSAGTRWAEIILAVCSIGTFAVVLYVLLSG